MGGAAMANYYPVQGQGMGHLLQAGQVPQEIPQQQAYAGMQMAGMQGMNLLAGLGAAQQPVLKSDIEAAIPNPSSKDVFRRSIRWRSR